MRRIIKLSVIFAVGVTLVGGLNGCSGFFKRDNQPTEDDILLGQEGATLWESNLQYVKIVAQDIKSAPANDQPMTMTSNDVRSVLGSVNVIDTKLFKKIEVPLFSAGELQILGTAISSGLSQAKANEDINFVSIGSHAGTLTKDLKTTTGRLFVKDGQLNIIFGLIHEIYMEKDPITGQPIDRRLNPLLPGKRSFDAQPAINVALMPGQAYYQDPKTGKERTDWLIIDIATALTAAKNKQADTALGNVTPELLEDIARNKQNTVNVRSDINNIKEVIFELRDDIDELAKKIEALQAKP